MITEQEMIDRLRDYIDQFDGWGRYTRASESLGIKSGALCNYLSGYQPIPGHVSAQLGYRRIRAFEPINRDAA